MLVSESTERGEIEEGEQEMLYKVFDFADKEVSDVMVPRPEVVALSVDLPPEQALQAVLESPYTRYPVYRGSLDEIVGVLHVRDLIEAMHERGIASVRDRGPAAPAYMVPETKDLAALLTEFRKQNQHMAIVLDEYGNMEGIVTLEDVLEEIVGEIEDEFDLPDESVERIDENTIRIDGTFPIDDFNEQFGVEMPQEDYHTVAGFVFGVLGRGAEVGRRVRVRRVRFRVDEVEGTRIQRLTVTFLPPPAGAGRGRGLMALFESGSDRLTSGPAAEPEGPGRSATTKGRRVDEDRASCSATSARAACTPAPAQGGLGGRDRAARRHRRRTGVAVGGSRRRRAPQPWPIRTPRAAGRRRRGTRLRGKALGGATTVSRATLERAAEQAKAIPSAGGSWEYAGADNIGGRVTDVVVDPTQANTIFVASAGGGVWKSTDAGMTYTPCLAGGLPPGDRRARPWLRRDALGGDGRGERLGRRHHVRRRRGLQVDGRRRHVEERRPR